MSGKLIDLSGRKFNRLLVINFSHMKGKHSYWKCECDCGNDKITRADCLKNNTVKSCGCLNREANGVKHGQHGTKLYHVWAGVKDRCNNPNAKHFKHYGGRGISICEEWKVDYIIFFNWAMEKGYKEGLTIERIDVNGNYEPSNCKWITQKEQAKNTTRNRKITYDGQTLNITEWAEELGINRNTLNARLNKANVNIKEAFTKPVESKVQRLSKAN
jgi:hypothetical protein